MGARAGHHRAGGQPSPRSRAGGDTVDGMTVDSAGRAGRRSFRAFVYPGRGGWHSAVRVSESGRQVTVDTHWLNADPGPWDEAARVAAESARRMEADYLRATQPGVPPYQPAT